MSVAESHAICDHLEAKLTAALPGGGSHDSRGAGNKTGTRRHRPDCRLTGLFSNIASRVQNRFLGATHTKESKMDWTQLLNQGRLCRPDYTDKPGRPAYAQDYDRILFSEPFRRLAQKTQVHPLYNHDHVHHRMIHSMETSSVGTVAGHSSGRGLGGARPDRRGPAARDGGHRAGGLSGA